MTQPFSHLSDVAIKSIHDTKISLLFYFVVPALLYVGLITQFDFDVFAPFGGWQAYNSYFLSMIEGRLDVPPSAIGREGQYWNGKAYMYYGALPVVVRAVASPFVDLSTTPLSKLSIWLFSAMGAASLQYSLLLKARRLVAEDGGGRAVYVFLLLSFSIWILSGSFIAVQNASIYHEPMAATLFLYSIYIAVVLHEYVFKERPDNERLVLLAAIAALCVHARPNTAIALYLCTLYLIVLSVGRRLRAAPRVDARAAVGEALTRRVVLALMILLVGGATLLAMNYTRFGSMVSLMDVEHYGFFLAGEGYSQRLCAFLEHGTFNVLRLIPNAMAYVVGAWELHGELVDSLGLGVVRKEGPFAPLALMWTLPIAVAAHAAMHRESTVRWERAGIYATMSLIPLLILSYATITYRYVIEIWPILALLGLGHFPALCARVGRLSRKAFAAAVRLSIAALLVNTAYGTFVYTAYKDAWADYEPRWTIEDFTTANVAGGSCGRDAE